MPLRSLETGHVQLFNNSNLYFLYSFNMSYLTSPGILQIHYSVVVRFLDSIMQQQKSSVTPQYGKKQKKSSKHQYPDCNAAMVDRENTHTPLPLLSALLEVLLIKKNIDKRYADMLSSKVWYRCSSLVFYRLIPNDGLK